MVARPGLAWRGAAVAPKVRAEERAAKELQEQYELTDLLKSCEDASDLARGRDIHARISASRKLAGDRYLGNLLVLMYGRCGSSREAKLAFEAIPQRNEVSYNSLVFAFAHTGQVRDMAMAYDLMPARTILASNIVLASLVSQGRLRQAQAMLKAMPIRDVVSWNTIIAGYVQHGQVVEAKRLFDSMSEPNVVTWTTMVRGYALAGKLQAAKRLFDEMPKRNSTSWSTILHAYAQCDEGSADEAREVLRRMPATSVFAWGAVAVAYAQEGHMEQAKEAFVAMPERNVYTWTILMGALASSSVDVAAQLVFKRMPAWSLVTLNCLLVAYAQAGRADDVEDRFSATPTEQRDVVTWTTLVAARAGAGRGGEAMNAFRDMVMLGMYPDAVTLTAALNALSHVGGLEDSVAFFRSIVAGDYSVAATQEHYCTMVDILSRSGMLGDAEDLLENMPFLPDVPAWGALLAGCRAHKNIEAAERAAAKLLSLEPGNAGHYVQLANAYAAVGRHKDAALIRKAMEDKGLVKVAGVSYIEIQGTQHRFIANDIAHPKNSDIRLELDRLKDLLKQEAGYVADTTEVLRVDARDEAEKESLLWRHSERMALAFGLLSTTAGATLRIMKNLRVCVDCHTVLKLLSGVCGRRIIVRDTTRFHRFENGTCSCLDYW